MRSIIKIYKNVLYFMSYYEWLVITGSNSGKIKLLHIKTEGFI